MSEAGKIIINDKLEYHEAEDLLIKENHDSCINVHNQILTMIIELNKKIERFRMSDNDILPKRSLLRWLDFADLCLIERGYKYYSGNKISEYRKGKIVIKISDLVDCIESHIDNKMDALRDFIINIEKKVI